MRLLKFKSIAIISGAVLLLLAAGCGSGKLIQPYDAFTEPVVVETLPPDGSLNVAVDGNVIASFNKAMNPLAINGNTFIVMGPGLAASTAKAAGDEEIEGEVSYDSLDDTAIFTPAGNFLPDTEYCATLTTDIEDIYGNPLPEDVSWCFMTGNTGHAPTILSTSPADGATDVAINAVITATFSAAMDPSTITAATFTVKDSIGDPVAGTVTYDEASLTATFTPSGYLAPATTFTITLTTGVKSLEGVEMAENYVWDFQTAKADYYVINEYPAPVFATLVPDQEYVIKDNVNYKLYYAGNDFASINLAQSPDGISWTPYAGNPIITDAQYHADVKFYSAGFAGANSGDNPSAATMYYRMWYQGLDGHSIGGWRYAESNNGINWYNRMPVSQFGPAVYDGVHMGVHYGIASVVYTPGASNTGTDWTFRIYANGQWEDAPYSGQELTVMAFSADGYNWTGYDPTNVGYATPVFAPSHVPGRFDRDHIGWFKVIKNSATDWEAFYSGGTDTTYQALNGIGYAISSDGINWTRSETLFTTADPVAWRDQSVWMPSVVKTESDYQIWFIGSDNPDIINSDWIQWKVGTAILPIGFAP
jgi:hypothetical protein